MEFNRKRPICPRDGSRFVPQTGSVCPRDGSCFSRTPSRPKCLWLVVSFARGLLPFLVLFGIPCFCPCEDLGFFLSVSPFFCRDFRGSQRTLPYCFSMESDSVVFYLNLLRIVIHFSEYSKNSVQNVVIHYVFSSEALRVVNSLRIVNSLRVLFFVCRGPLGSVGENKKKLFFCWGGGFPCLFSKKKHGEEGQGREKGYQKWVPSL